MGSDATDFQLAGVTVPPGTRRRIEVEVAQTYGPEELVLPLVVRRGRKDGPRLFVSAAVHGDEINGVEIARRLLRMKLRGLAGTLICVPVVNVYGFLHQSRYLPDGRDLNRGFPGSPTGSLTARLAHVFMREVVERATHGVDLHTASGHRSNLPHVRACIDDAETERLARAFGVPVIPNAKLRDGSLRQAVHERKIPMLLYECGQALRFDELSIRAGVRGIMNVMRAIGMLPAGGSATEVEPLIARSSRWLRAQQSGILRTGTGLGAQVKEGQVLGYISDPLGERVSEVEAQDAGIVIGRTEIPLVNEGDSLFHVASCGAPERAARGVETLRTELDPAGSPSPSGEPPIV